MNNPPDNPQLQARSTLRAPRRRKALFFLVVLVFALLLAEAIVRITGVDWRFIRQGLYYQGVDAQAHVIDLDSEILYRLRPNFTHLFSQHGDGTTPRIDYRVSINAFGARGPQRSEIKPEGVFRIIVLGGSNAYGAPSSDDRTWPTQLETLLNRQSPGRYEVWNFGTCAYVGVQMGRIGLAALDRFDPDLVILALSNSGQPAFLLDSDPRPIFLQHPELWQDLFPEAYVQSWPCLSEKTQTWLISRVRAYRMGLLAMSAISKAPLWAGNPRIEQRNDQRMRDLLLRAKKIARACVFHGPYPSIYRDNSQKVRGLIEPTHTPYFLLDANAPTFGDDYRNIHPPSHVYAWYAENLAGWLFEQGLIPTGRPDDKG